MIHFTPSQTQKGARMHLHVKEETYFIWEGQQWCEEAARTFCEVPRWDAQTYRHSRRFMLLLLLDDEAVGVIDWPEYRQDMKRHAAPECPGADWYSHASLWEKIIHHDIRSMPRHEHSHFLWAVFRSRISRTFWLIHDTRIDSTGDLGVLEREFQIEKVNFKSCI